MSAHFVTNDDGGGYWREFLTCSDGRTVTGTGDTPETAHASAILRLHAREDYLRLPIKERLKILAAGNLLSTDMTEAVRLLIQLVYATADNATGSGCQRYE